MKRVPLAIQNWQQQLTALWPAAKGSLAKVYKPCIRPHCPACTRGDKHPAWMLSFSERGRRRILYVPLALVPQLQQAIQNGRKLEQLLYRIGPALVKGFRQSRKKTSKPRTKS